MPHRFVRTGAAVQTSPYHNLLQSGLPSRRGPACGHDLRKTPGLTAARSTSEPSLQTGADVVSRVDAAIGEQAF
jgi:hypothetical protein